MNCDEFLARMHDHIDCRLPLDEDAKLRSHAKRCTSCQEKWNAWRRIASTLTGPNNRTASPPQTDVPNRRVPNTLPIKPSRTLIGFGLAVAASVMLMVLSWSFGGLNNDQVGSSAITTTAMTVQNQGPDGSPSFAFLSRDPAISPDRWWEEVQQRDWLAQTMPTVRSVRDGVAPLGRSILQAVSILTIGSGERPS